MKNTKYQIGALTLAILMAFVFGGCGKTKENTPGGAGKGSGKAKEPVPIEVGPVEMSSVEEVKDFYESSPKFFVIKKAEDIPEDLKWEDRRQSHHQCH